MGARWTEDEDALVRRYYPDHGRSWAGWRELLPSRPLAGIAARAGRLGVRLDGNHGGRPRGVGRHNKRTVAPSPSRRGITCGGCAWYDGDHGGAGRCAEPHAHRLFCEQPQVLACYDASLCAWCAPLDGADVPERKPEPKPKAHHGGYRPTPEQRERARMVVAMREGGATYAAIGERIGTSGERARQIYIRERNRQED